MEAHEALAIARSLRGLGRAVDEWVGDTPDTAPPPRVKDRVLLRFDRCCYNCGNRIVGRRWICDHIAALINGGENREGNLGPLCDICNPRKNAADVQEKSEIYKKRASHHQKRRRGRPMPGSRDSPYKIGIDGTVTRRGPK